jgi:hypothetical protein
MTCGLEKENKRQESKHQIMIYIEKYIMACTKGQKEYRPTTAIQ